jgi:hypothetical protein
MFMKLCLATACIAFVASSAQAALVINAGGTVLLNQGKGFSEVATITEVHAGDRILVRGEGRAQIDYGDGCLVELSANQSAVVSASSGCAESALYSTSSTSASPASGSLKDTPAAVAPQTTDTNDGLIIGGLVIAGGAAVALGGDHDSSKPTSP